MRSARPIWAAESNSTPLCIHFAGGCFFVCRKNRMRGGCMIAFGLGLLLGQWIDSAFLCILAGLMLLTLGWCVLRQR